MLRKNSRTSVCVKTGLKSESGRKHSKVKGRFIEAFVCLMLRHDMSSQIDKQKRKKFEAFYLNLSLFPLYLLCTKVAEVNQYPSEIYRAKVFSLATLICAFLTFAG